MGTRKKKSQSPKRARTRAVPAHSQRRARGDATLERLRRDILTGKLAPGTRLLPERELAEKLNTNRNTLREALRILELEHLIRSRQGDGTMVLNWRQDAELSLLPAFMREDTPIEDRIACAISLMALRDQLLEFGVRKATLLHTPEELHAIRTAVIAMRVPGNPSAALIRLDIEFYRRIVMATHDLVLTWSFNIFGKVFAGLGETFPALWPIDEAYLTRVDRLVDHIARRQPDLAAKELLSILAERSGAITATLPS